MASYKNTAIIPGTDAEVAAQVAKIDANLTPTPGVIPVSTLSAPTPTPAKVVSPAPTTSGINLSANMAQTAVQNDAQYTKDLADKQKAAEAGKTASFDALLKNMLGTDGQTALTANEYASTGVDSSSQELRAINNQMLADQVATRHEIESLRANNPMGLSTEAINSQIQDIQDKSLTRQADLAVVQMAKQGQYDSAKTIADRAVAAKMERQKTINEALKLSYEENKDLFTTAEKRQFETAQKDRERKLEMDTYKEKARYDQIIKQNDPLYQANLSKAQSEAKALLDTTGGINVNALPGASTSEKNGAAITALIKNGKVGQGTKTQLANVLGVVNAAEELAKNNIEGKFEGINPLTGILSTKVFGVGLPFRETVKGAKQLQNEGYIEAINLRTQIWASGASLTKQQIDQVNRFTPRVNDTDSVVQAKLNSLANFMLNQTKTQLQSEGIAFEPATVDLFETAKLIKQASPEQRAELKAAGLIK